MCSSCCGQVYSLSLAYIIKTNLKYSLFPSLLQVYSLDNPSSFYYFYSSKPNDEKNKILENLAEQIATLCDTLKEYPAIRYYK